MGSCLSKPKPPPRKRLTKEDVNRLYPVRPHQLRAQKREEARIAAGLPGLGEMYATSVSNAALSMASANSCARPSRYSGLV
jgi:hypothetical protein